VDNRVILKKSHEKDIIAMLILFPGLLLWSQDNTFTKEINEQVWMAFIRSFGNGDEELFKQYTARM
jgi:hypothetical protein